MGPVKTSAVALMCGVALSAVATGGAVAQQAAATPRNANTANVTLLERLVIGAGAPKVAINTPQAVTVVNQADIDQAQATTTGKIFDSVPGVTMVGSERQFGEAFNIRGIGTTENSSDGSRVVVNIDGTPKFNEQYRMGSFFSDPELYKSVEILRGPASSTLYGAGALGGVINFTTKDASDFIKDGYSGAARVKTSFSSNGLQTLTSALVAQQVTDTFEVLATANWRRSQNLDLAKGGELPGSAFNTLSGLVKGTLHFGDNNEQTLRASYQRWYSTAKDQAYAQTGTQSIFGITDREVIDQTAVLAWENPATDNPWVDLKVNLSFSDTTNDQTNHRDFLGGPQTGQTGTDLFADTRYGYKTWQLKADNTVEWIGDNFENYFTFGVQGSTQDRTATRPGTALPLPAHPQGTENKLGLYAQDEFNWDKKLTLIAGARGDFHWINSTTGAPNSEGSAFSPKLAALYQVNDTLGLFGSVAHTERLPTIDELYSVSAAKYAALNLQKEQANTIEGGFTLSHFDMFQPGDTASLKTTAFYSDLTNLIVSNAGAGVPYYGNIGAARIYGLEIEGSYDSDVFYANAAYSITTGQNLQTNTPLTTVPQAKLVTTVGAHYREWNANFGVRATFTGKGEYAYPTASGGDGPADAFTSVDLFASWKPDYGVFAGTELTAGIDNVFNANYRENLSTDRSTGRTFKLTLAKQFDY